MAEAKEPKVPHKIGPQLLLCVACAARVKIWRATDGIKPVEQRSERNEPSIRTADLMVQGTSICFEDFDVQPPSNLVVANGQVPRFS